MSLNTDRLSSVSPHRAAEVAFRVLDRIQDLSPEEQAAGISLLLVMFAKRFGLAPREVSALLDQGGMRVQDALRAQINDKPGDLVRAIRQYMKEEL